MNSRILCLHGFGTNAEFMRFQLRASNWEVDLRGLVNFHSINGMYESSVGMIPTQFPTKQYYKWWDAHQNENGTYVYTGWRETTSYISQYINQNGPFDGLLGFSQGACLVSLILALQQQRVEFTDCPLFKFAILIGGFPSRDPDHNDLYKDPIQYSSLHVYGEQDEMKSSNERLIQHFSDPVVVVHSRGHIIPKLEEMQLNLIRQFLISNTERSRI